MPLFKTVVPACRLESQRAGQATGGVIALNDNLRDPSFSRSDPNLPPLRCHRELILCSRPYRIVPPRSRSVPLYHVDAFTSHRFQGNPAAVVVLASYPSDRELQAIAAENNLSETAFLVRSGRDYNIRWFTPKTEVPLCGHATLASSAVVMERLEKRRTSVVFHSRTGPLTVTRRGSRYAMDFPAAPPSRISPSEELSVALGSAPSEMLSTQSEYLAVFPRESEVRALRPDFTRLATLDRAGVIATAPSSPPYDFVSRCFGPAMGIPEDPVTGSAHCVLAPYWARRLGKSNLRAYQASSRGGEMSCIVKGDRVTLEGKCVFFLEGTAQI